MEEEFRGGKSNKQKHGSWNKGAFRLTTAPDTLQPLEGFPQTGFPGLNITVRRMALVGGGVVLVTAERIKHHAGQLSHTLESDTSMLHSIL